MSDNLLKNSLEMYNKTIEEMKSISADTTIVEEAKSDIEMKINMEKCIALDAAEKETMFNKALKNIKPKKLDKDEYAVLNKIHSLSEENEKHNTQIPLEERILENKHREECRLRNEAYKIDRIKNKGMEDMYSVREPITDNRYLVTLPDKYDTMENEIMMCGINRFEKQINLTIRESVGSKQKLSFLYNKQISNWRQRKNNDEIIVHYLRPDLSDDYCAVFSHVKVINIEESLLTYNQSEPHTLFVTFSFDDEKIVRGVVYKKESLVNGTTN